MSEATAARLADTFDGAGTAEIFEFPRAKAHAALEPAERAVLVAQFQASMISQARAMGLPDPVFEPDGSYICRTEHSAGFVNTADF